MGGGTVDDIGGWVGIIGCVGEAKDGGAGGWVTFVERGSGRGIGKPETVPGTPVTECA